MIKNSLRAGFPLSFLVLLGLLGGSALAGREGSIKTPAILSHITNSTELNLSGLFLRYEVRVSPENGSPDEPTRHIQELIPMVRNPETLEWQVALPELDISYVFEERDYWGPRFDFYLDIVRSDLKMEGMQSGIHLWGWVNGVKERSIVNKLKEFAEYLPRMTFFQIPALTVRLGDHETLNPETERIDRSGKVYSLPYAQVGARFNYPVHREWLEERVSQYDLAPVLSDGVFEIPSILYLLVGRFPDPCTQYLQTTVLFSNIDKGPVKIVHRLRGELTNLHTDEEHLQPVTTILRE